MSSTSQFVRKFSTVAPKNLNNRTFDFIIIGAGSAGSTLAHRLSESKAASVLVLEAGAARDPKLPSTDLSLISTPGINLWNHRNPETDWNYYTTPQKTFEYCRTPGVITYCRGRGLGGSGAINFNMWVRGVKEDQDTWEKLGAKGWNFENCKPYFKKAENVQEAIRDGLTGLENRGLDGPVEVSIGSPATKNSHKAYKTDEWVRISLDAFRAHGFQEKEINNGGWSGNVIGRMEYSISNGKRSYAGGYLEKILSDRPNLELSLGAHVASLIFEGDRATGIQVIDEKGAPLAKVYAKNEIILASGVANSPKVLMLSGIGPKDHLNSLGIQVRRNLPVGENWSDHFYLGYKALGGDVMKRSGIYGQFITPEDFTNYAKHGTGVFSKVFGDVYGYMKVIGLREDGGPDLQIIGFPLSFFDPYMLTVFNIDEKKKFPVLTEPHQPSQMWAATIAQPKSRGFLKLNSINPLDPPAIDPNFLSHEMDRKAMIEAYKVMEKIATDERFFAGAQSICPGLKTDEEILNHVHSAGYHGWHGSGTCRMGDPSLASSVVDPSLRVIGFQGLRVVDGSVLPVVSSGNTNAPSIMVAEKGADLIKADYGNLYS